MFLDFGHQIGLICGHKFYDLSYNKNDTELHRMSEFLFLESKKITKQKQKKDHNY